MLSIIWNQCSLKIEYIFSCSPFQAILWLLDGFNLLFLFIKKTVVKNIELYLKLQVVKKDIVVEVVQYWRTIWKLCYCRQFLHNIVLKIELYILFQLILKIIVIGRWILLSFTAHYKQYCGCNIVLLQSITNNIVMERSIHTFCSNSPHTIMVERSKYIPEPADGI